MIDAPSVQMPIAAKFVGVEGRAGKHIFMDHGNHRLVTTRVTTSRPLRHADQSRTCCFCSRCLCPKPSRRSVLVNFNDEASTSERGVAVNVRHMLADLAAHAPRRFISHA